MLLIMNDLFDIKGKVVVVTGACGVLGSAIVSYFGRMGCKVALLGLERARERSEKLIAGIEGTPGEAHFFASDVLFFFLPPNSLTCCGKICCSRAGRKSCSVSAP